MKQLPAPIPVILDEYNSKWPHLAEDYAHQLRSIGPNLLAVHHIGSTAIPNLTAKPIIDLMPVVASLLLLDQNRLAVEALGFQWYGELGISGRRYCTLSGRNGLRKAQLHFYEANSPHITRHLAFRDYLRAHRHIALEYQAEKHRAQKLFPNNSHEYSEEKSAWIKEVEAKALDWFTKH